MTRAEIARRYQQTERGRQVGLAATRRYRSSELGLRRAAERLESLAAATAQRRAGSLANRIRRELDAGAKPVPGYPGTWATRDGCVHGRSGRTLHPHPLGAYLRVNVALPTGARCHRFVHVLVALAFLGSCPPGHEVNHKNGVGNDNRVDNLEYVTPSGNIRHSLDVLGRQRARGEANGQSLLTADLVREIRRRRALGANTQELSEMAGVTRGQINRVCSGEAWRHIPMEEQ